MGLSETKNIKIVSFNFFTKSWGFIPNGPTVSKSKLHWPKIESDIARQQNQSELPEGCLSQNVTLCYLT